MNSRNKLITTLICTSGGATVLLLAGISLSGCGDDHSGKLQPLPGNREAKETQRDMEIPPGIQKAAPKSAPKASKRPID